MTDGPLSEQSDNLENGVMKAEVFLPDDYRPAENEPFMNDRQLEYFRRKLIVVAVPNFQIIWRISVSNGPSES